MCHFHPSLWSGKAQAFPLSSAHFQWWSLDQTLSLTNARSKNSWKSDSSFLQLLRLRQAKKLGTFPTSCEVNSIPFDSQLLKKKYHGNFHKVSFLLLLPKKVEDQPHKQAIVQIRKLTEMFSVFTVFIKALLSLWTRVKADESPPMHRKAAPWRPAQMPLVSLLTSIHGQSWKSLHQKQGRMERRKGQSGEGGGEREGRREGMGEGGTNRSTVSWNTTKDRRQIILLSDGVQPHTHYFPLPKRQFISCQYIQIRLFQLPF